jgi:hypothetical protein
MKGVDMGARDVLLIRARLTLLTSRSTGKVEQKVDHRVRICNYCDHPISVALNVTSAS